MPFDLASVERGYGEVPVPYNGHTIVVQYRADIDGRSMRAIQGVIVGVPTAMDKSVRFPDLDSVVAELARVLVGWDITRDGQPVPITQEEIRRLPADLPFLLLQTVVGDIHDPNRRRPSHDGSSVGASSEPTPSPTTTASSTTPSGPASHPGLSLVSGTMPPPGPVGAVG